MWECMASKFPCCQRDYFKASHLSKTSHLRYLVCLFVTNKDKKLSLREGRIICYTITSTSKKKKSVITINNISLSFIYLLLFIFVNSFPGCFLRIRFLFLAIFFSFSKKFASFNCQFTK